MVHIMTMTTNLKNIEMYATCAIHEECVAENNIAVCISAWFTENKRLKCEHHVPGRQWITVSELLNPVKLNTYG